MPQEVFGARPPEWHQTSHSQGNSNMSITYQYYRQGSSQLVQVSATAATSSAIFNFNNINHISVISSAAASLLVTQSGTIVGATTAGSAMGQYIPANTEVIIPCVKATGCSIFGYSAGSAWITEFLAA